MGYLVLNVVNKKQQDRNRKKNSQKSDDLTFRGMSGIIPKKLEWWQTFLDVAKQVSRQKCLELPSNKLGYLGRLYSSFPMNITKYSGKPPRKPFGMC